MGGYMCGLGGGVFPLKWNHEGNMWAPKRDNKLQMCVRLQLYVFSNVVVNPSTFLASHGNNCK